MLPPAEVILEILHRTASLSEGLVKKPDIVRFQDRSPESVNFADTQREAQQTKARDPHFKVIVLARRAQ